MTRAPLPGFYDDLDATFVELWRLLADGAEQGRSGFHLPTLATCGTDGGPRARTVVLRAADGAAGSLRFHCDRRSDKAAEILAHPACALAAYDETAKVQIRVEGRATLHTDDPVAEAAWTGSRAMSRVCYGAEPAPGTALPEGGAYSLPDEASAQALGRPHFAAVLVRAERLDFLYLDRRGPPAGRLVPERGRLARRVAGTLTAGRGCTAGQGLVSVRPCRGIGFRLDDSQTGS